MVRASGNGANAYKLEFNAVAGAAQFMRRVNATDTGLQFVGSQTFSTTTGVLVALAWWCWATRSGRRETCQRGNLPT